MAFSNPISSADLSVGISADNETPDEADTIQLTVTTSNLGPELATGVQVTEALPAGLTF